MSDIIPSAPAIGVAPNVGPSPDVGAKPDVGMAPSTARVPVLNAPKEESVKKPALPFVATSMRVFVPAKVLRACQAIQREYPRLEFSVLAKTIWTNHGVYLSEEFIIPEQFVSSGHIDYEPLAMYRKDGWNAVIHSHHELACGSFSSTDDTYINSFFHVSVLFNRNNFVTAIINFDVDGGFVRKAATVAIRSVTDGPPQETVVTISTDKPVIKHDGPRWDRSVDYRNRYRAGNQFNGPDEHVRIVTADRYFEGSYNPNTDPYAMPYPNLLQNAWDWIVIAPLTGRFNIGEWIAWGMIVGIIAMLIFITGMVYVLLS